MRVKYSVTFEYLRQPPQTHTGTVAGGKVSTCVSRATKEAQAVLSPQGWSSMVCVLLERLDADPDTAELEQDTDEPPAAGAVDPVEGTGQKRSTRA